jgi:hypothetical protein
MNAWQFLAGWCAASVIATAAWSALRTRHKRTAQAHYIAHLRAQHTRRIDIDADCQRLRDTIRTPPAEEVDER